MKPRRRRFSAVTKEQLTNLQLIRERLRRLKPITPYDRECELQAMDNIISEHQDRLLDGEDLRHDMAAVRAVKSAGLFRRSIEAEARR